MREQLENLKHWSPLACAIIGMWIVESNLAFLPWKLLALVLVGVSAIYAVRTTWHIKERKADEREG